MWCRHHLKIAATLAHPALDSIDCRSASSVSASMYAGQRPFLLGAWMGFGWSVPGYPEPDDAKTPKAFLGPFRLPYQFPRLSSTVM